MKHSVFEPGLEKFETEQHLDWTSITCRKKEQKTVIRQNLT